MASIDAENVAKEVLVINKLRSLPITTNLYWDFLHETISRETETDVLIALLVESNRVIDSLSRFLPTKEKKVYYSNKQPSEDRYNINHSLRYFVLQRDSFHCVLCGRGAEDNVKLQVDHIMPFSKGGKTREDNLRTLCFECNIGKLDQ